MKLHYVLKYEVFNGRMGVGLYVNGNLVRVSSDVFTIFRMVVEATNVGDSVRCELGEDYRDEELERMLKGVPLV